MIEANLYYDLLPNIDMKAYGEWVKTVMGTITKQPGMVEFRANRNVLGGTPMIRTCTIWQSLGDWSRFAEDSAWQSMQMEMRGFANNIRLELWGPSPMVPEPIKPAK